MNNMPQNEGTDASDKVEQRMIGNLILIINVMTLVWPIARKVLTGKHVEYYEKLVWCLGLPHSCYMKYCGGEKRAAARREKEKEARAERRRNAGVRRSQSMLHIDVENVHAWKVDASLVLADVDKAESSDRIIAGNTDGHASAEHGPNAKEGQSRSQSSRALEDAPMESHRGISTLEDAPMAVEATKVNGQNGSTAGNGNSNGNGTHTAGPTGAQATAPSAAPAAAHGTPDLEPLKADILKCMAEAVEESKAPDSTLHTPVPFKAIHRLLQGRNLDVDDKKLQKLFDECDADRVSG